MDLDSIDKKLLNLVQGAFPLTSEPYSALGQRLGINGSEVISRIKRLKEEGIIRQIGPVLEARRLGYQPTLIAMKVEETELDRAEQIISQHPGVSHGYERDHHFNLWFTLVVPPEVDIVTELELLTSSFEAKVVFTLPAVKVFKIGVYFNMDGQSLSQADTMTQPGGVLLQKAELTQIDRLVINELQQELPLVTTPFSTMAIRLDMNEEYFLTQCHSLLQHGIMRRFSASVNHNRAGFKANAMVCWMIPPDLVDVAGQNLASLPEVSHCYERKTNPLWQYNLFAMVHSRTRDACREKVSEVSHQIGLNDYILLFSTREFKKMRVKYLV